MLDFAVVALHCGCGQHFAEKKENQPGRAFLDHSQKRNGGVRLVQRFHTAEFVDVFGRLLFGDVEHVVAGDDSNENAAGIGHRQRDPVVFSKSVKRRLLGIIYFEIDKRFVSDVANFGLERLKQKLSHPHVVDQFAALIDHVDDVEGFAVVAEFANVVENFFHRPIFVNRDEIRRH